MNSRLLTNKLNAAVFLTCGIGTSWSHAATEAESASFRVDTLVHILDTDGDQMPDAWELANGLNPSLSNASGNPDGDHLNNLGEYNSGTNPQIADFPETRFAVSGSFALSIRPLAVDQDGDGMPDAWEAANGLNLTINDAGSDFDQDGVTNLGEYNSGWNPRVAEMAATLSAQSGLFLTNTGAYPAGFTRDSEGDGMPDWWEASYALNLSANDGALDPDSDRLTNFQEYQTGHDPRRGDLNGEDYEVSATFIGNFSGRLPDTDSDGIPNAWEIAFGTDPLVADSIADPDGDGRSNIIEYNAGTNPLLDDWRGPAVLASGNFLADTGGFNNGYSPDSDHDRMPDWWEIKYGLSPYVADAQGNLDADALSNLEEYNAGSDPSRFGYLILVDAQGNVFTCDTGGVFVDTDNDGIPDWWERHYVGNRTAMIPGSDSDHDGQSNLAEYQAGLSPLDPASRFAVDGFEMSEDASGRIFTIRWKSMEGRRYKIFRTENLIEPWPLAPIATVDGDGNQKIFSLGAQGSEKMFVRIEVEVIRP